jgi:hypothetical protein
MKSPFVLMLLLFAAGNAQAAIWPSASAPCNGTLQACINATPAGGAVLVRSSAAIDEELVINKSFSLFAAPGYRPRLSGSRSIASSAPAGASYFFELRGIDLTRGRVSVNANAATNATVTLERVNVEAGIFAAAIEIVGGSGVLTVDLHDCRIVKPSNIAEPGQSAIGIAALGSSARLRLFHNRIVLDDSDAGAAIRLRTRGETRLSAVGNDIRGRRYMAGINAVQTGAGSILNAALVANVVRGQVGGVEAPGALSIRVDAGNARLVLRHNTLVRNDKGIALYGASGSFVPSAIDRNIIAWNRDGISIPASEQPQVSVDNNLFHANVGNAYLAGTANLVADPRFVSGHNLRLGADSPGLGAATFSSPIAPLDTLPDLDADGFAAGSGAIDLGAYQRHGTHVLHRATGGSGTLSSPGIPAGSFVPFHASQNWNPPGSAGVYNDSAIGLRYTTGWSLFNQDGTALPAGSAFNVFVPFRHGLPFRDTSTSTSSASASLDSLPASLHTDPKLFWLFTLNRTVTTTFGTLNPHPVALLYFNGWHLHNTDAADFPQNASYSLYWQETSPNAYVHFVSAANRSGHITTLDHPLLNGNRCAMIQFAASTAGGVFNPHELGAYYTGSRWALFNQDFAALADDVAVNVLVDPAQAESCDRLFADGYE